MVSVIIPTFERDEKLKRALLSVIQQTYSDIEILVINDSNSDIVVKRIIKQINDVRIKYFKNERLKGANGARNTGILKAKGEYIAFLDDDDEFLENKLKTQIRCLKNKDESWGGVYSAYIIENNKRWKEFKKGNEGYLLKDILLNNLSLCAGSNILIKAETIPIVGLWDENLYRQQDIEFLVRFSNIFKIAFDNNVSAKIYGHNLPDYFKTFEEREKFLNKIDTYLNILSRQDKKKFLSDHFRRQVTYLVRQKEFKKAFKFFNRAMKYRLFSIRKDFKIISLTLKTLLKK